MIKNYNTYKILKLFFDFPRKKFQLRELSRLTKIGLPSVINHVKILEKEQLVKKVSEGIYDSYVSSRNEKFKSHKRNDTLLRLEESGLIDFLADEFVPDVIALFGSASRGEDLEESDIDLFILAKESDLKLQKFEKILNRKISLHFEDKLSDLPKELLNNIANGIVLYGYLKVV